MEKRPAMGSLAWAEMGGGKLTGLQPARLLANMAWLQIREIVDVVRFDWLRGSVRSIDLQTLAPPQSALVDDCLALAMATHQPALLAHSWRTYYFARLLAAQEGIAHDAQLLFAAAILHDLGLTDDHAPPLAQCCFAVSGARRTCRHLHEHGHGQAVIEQVGEAIALHLNAWVSRRRHGAVAHLLARGAVCDLFGFSRRRLASADVAALLRKYPRHGVLQALQFETAQHLPGSRADWMVRLGGRKAPRDPFRRWGEAGEQ